MIYGSLIFDFQKLTLCVDDILRDMITICRSKKCYGRDFLNSIRSFMKISIFPCYVFIILIAEFCLFICLPLCVCWYSQKIIKKNQILIYRYRKKFKYSLLYHMQIKKSKFTSDYIMMTVTQFFLYILKSI